MSGRPPFQARVVDQSDTAEFLTMQDLLDRIEALETDSAKLKDGLALQEKKVEDF